MVAELSTALDTRLVHRLEISAARFESPVSSSGVDERAMNSPIADGREPRPGIIMRVGAVVKPSVELQLPKHAAGGGVRSDVPVGTPHREQLDGGPNRSGGAPIIHFGVAKGRRAGVATPAIAAPVASSWREPTADPCDCLRRRCIGGADVLQLLARRVVRQSLPSPGCRADALC